MLDIQNITTQQMIFGVCLFGAVSMSAFILVGSLLGNNKDPLRERLQGGRGARRGGFADEKAAAEAAALRVSSISPTVQKITRAVAQPLMPKDRAEVSRI